MIPHHHDPGNCVHDREGPSGGTHPFDPGGCMWDRVHDRQQRQMAAEAAYLADQRRASRIREDAKPMRGATRQARQLGSLATDAALAPVRFTRATADRLVLEPGRRARERASQTARGARRRLSIKRLLRRD